MCRRVVARDRASRPARNQREETGAFGEGRVSQVGNCVGISGGLLTVTDVPLSRNLESRLAAQGSQSEFRE